MVVVPEITAVAAASIAETTKPRQTRLRPPRRPEKATSLAWPTMVLVLVSEGNHAFEHHAVEPAAVLDVVVRIAEVGLLDILGLGHQARQDEPAAAELDALRADVLRHAER